MSHSSRYFMAIIGTAWLFDAMDVALLSFIMPLLKVEWSLTAGQLGLVSASTSLGMVVGAPLCGLLADKYGRKNVLIGTLILFSLSNILLTLTQNVSAFIVIRFITGIGLGGELPVAATAVADRFQGKKQAKMLVVADSFWAIGWIIAALLSFFVMPKIGWRYTIIVASITVIFAFIMRRHLSDEPLKPQKSKQTLRSLWRSEHRRPLIVLGALWFVVMLSYYGMFLWLPSVLVLRGLPIVNSFGYTLLISFAQLPGYFFAVYLLDKLSRKRVLFIYLIGTIVSALAFGVAVSNTMVLVCGAFLSFFMLGTWGTLIALTPSQFPQEIRGTGMGTAQAVGRVGAVVGPFLVGMALEFNFSITSIWLGFVAILIVGVLILVTGISKEDDSYAKDLANAK
ncbi:MFS transporter [Paucilactobacillus nenjiangensis]|uniref:MFS transporter n=1 Tax=Paucilactobacillus nenjiangensis TaxID=1296540 RepID=UPI0028D19936|nr:MFS transporter [Paucilactobacillus nenjiangensis]